MAYINYAVPEASAYLEVGCATRLQFEHVQFKSLNASIYQGTRQAMDQLRN